MNEALLNIKSPENRIEKQEVLNMLREKGLDGPEVRKLVMDWTIQQEALVEKEGTSRASIMFNIGRSDLYIATGDINGAIGCLEDALVQAHQENEIELRHEIIERMKEIVKGN